MSLKCHMLWYLVKKKQKGTATSACTVNQFIRTRVSHTAVCVCVTVCGLFAVCTDNLCTEDRRRVCCPAEPVLRPCWSQCTSRWQTSRHGDSAGCCWKPFHWGTFLSCVWFLPRLTSGGRAVLFSLQCVCLFVCLFVWVQINCLDYGRCLD